MTGPRSQSEHENPPVAAATGVAAGGLGTGANLDETQVFRTEELAKPSASRAAPPAEPEPVTNPEMAEVAAEPVPTPVSPPTPAPTPIAPAPVVARRATSPRERRGRGLAGVLAAALVVLAGVAFVVTRDAGTPVAGQTVPSAAAPATAPPEGNGAAGDGDDRGRDGAGKDNGKDKPCNGNGKGRGCGGDDDKDDD